MSDIRLPYIPILEILSAPPANSIPEGIRLMGASLEWPETQGEGVKVAVLDTGRPNHPDITVADALDLTGTHPDDKHGHQTHVMGTIGANGGIKGMAPKCGMYSVKVLTDNGGGDWDTIINKGINWCIANKMDIISMSLGGSRPPNHMELHKAVQKAEAAGILMIAAAGNMGLDFKETVMYPAVWPEVMAVTAVDFSKQRADFTSTGREAELCAPGVEIYSTHLNGQYVKLSGTSMACPHITGAAALIIAKLRKRGLPATPQMVRWAMKLYADDIGIPGWDEVFGYGFFSFGRVDKADVVRPKIEMWIDNPVAMVEGKPRQIDPLNNNVAPRLLEGRTMTPSRFVAETLGANVAWDGTQRKVTIW